MTPTAYRATPTLGTPMVELLYSKQIDQIVPVLIATLTDYNYCLAETVRSTNQQPTKP